MKNIILIVPNKELESKAIAYKEEHFSCGETVINGSEMWDNMDSYPEWLEMVTKNADIETYNQGWVLTDTFFAMRQSDKKIIGIIAFRHSLNEFLKDFGHIGYSVCPLERRKGYATEMLRQVLAIAKEQGLAEVFLSYMKGNVPSKKTILNNGGEYLRDFTFNNEVGEVFSIVL
ncbi:GNAT family N-acetyltransferase [Clostridium estertheticum]|uniref:GNAT family N-acetyltransferase n=1 Tax=Clostridium estertheticum TaxID=238834 RepID=UPI001CF14D92|nr:GNAT family N-acetyltransferase [Clostridium estertheticum]MCB2339130.1 GNAT family N-acetyltransferase [Clostridium estertheticum]